MERSPAGGRNTGWIQRPGSMQSVVEVALQGCDTHREGAGLAKFTWLSGGPQLKLGDPPFVTSEFWASSVRSPFNYHQTRSIGSILPALRYGYIKKPLLRVRQTSTGK